MEINESRKRGKAMEEFERLESKTGSVENKQEEEVAVPVKCIRYFARKTGKTSMEGKNVLFSDLYIAPPQMRYTNPEGLCMKGIDLPSHLVPVCAPFRHPRKAQTKKTHHFTIYHRMHYDTAVQYRLRIENGYYNVKRPSRYYGRNFNK
jgi:hypothetical protein